MIYIRFPGFLALFLVAAALVWGILANGLNLFLLVLSIVFFFVGILTVYACYHELDTNDHVTEAAVMAGIIGFVLITGFGGLVFLILHGAITGRVPLFGP